MLPNGSHMSSTHTQQLSIPTLPPAACVQHRFPAMKTTGLLSIGQLCDHGCSATFYQHHLVIKNKRATTILVGHQTLQTACGWSNCENRHDHTPRSLPLAMQSCLVTPPRNTWHSFIMLHWALPSPLHSSRQLTQAYSPLSQDSPHNLWKNTSPRASRQARSTWTRSVKTYNQPNRLVRVGGASGCVLMGGSGLALLRLVDCRVLRSWSMWTLPVWMLLGSFFHQLCGESWERGEEACFNCLKECRGDGGAQ